MDDPRPVESIFDDLRQLIALGDELRRLRAENLAYRKELDAFWREIDANRRARLAAEERSDA